MDTIVSTLWLLFCSFLVYLMQVGFLLLESGMVRKKNNSSVAFKNFVDFAFAFLIFLIFGFAIYNGPSVGGFFGKVTYINYFDLSSEKLVHFLYMAGFATATCTIVSGAIAERINSYVYTALTIIISLFCFPFVAHWVWNSEGLLASWGYIDLAGGTAVHAAGGMAALTATIVLGPRKGVDLKKGLIPSPSSNVEVVFGAFLLIICWIGFNAGSQPMPNKTALIIIINTLVAACSGFISVFFYSMLDSTKLKSIPDISNGALTGIVSITSCAHIASIEVSILIGAIAGIVGIKAQELISKRIDDVVGAVSVHLVGGTLGILSIPFIQALSAENKIDVFLNSMKIQFLGHFMVLVWVFAIVFLSLKLIGLCYPLRVSEESEDNGLNHAEFGIRDELHDFFDEIDEQIKSQDFTRSVNVEGFTIVGKIADKYNTVTNVVCEMFEKEEQLKQQIVQTSNLAATGEMASGIAHEINNPLGIIKLTLKSLQRYLTKKELMDENVNEFIEDINTTADRINKITVGLRNISRNSDENDLSVFSLAELFDDTMTLSHEKCRQNTINFSFPESTLTANHLVEANRIQISQAIINLLNNAYDAISEQQNDDKWINVGLDNADEEFHYIRLSDSGKGIPEEVVNKMFNPFFTTKDIGKGTGIGLSISKKIMQKSGGDLFYELFEGNTSFVLKIKKAKEIRSA